MRSIAGNVSSDKLPGGSLIAAVLDRQLMTWSDRGGASRYFGDRWSEQCAAALDGWIGSERPVPGDSPYVLEAVVRLDENPEIAIEAGRHQLVNPDFILYGSRGEREQVLQAADAKFAVDTIRSPQVSAEALQALLDVEHGLVGQALTRELNEELVEPVSVARGVFLSPISPLTDYFLPRVTSGPRATVDPAQVVLFQVDTEAMFIDLPMSGLIRPLAAVDGLGPDPWREILAGMYYFRVACACYWMWVEAHTPLLSLETAPEPPPDALASEVERRARTAASAFDLLVGWSGDVEEVERARQALREVAPMPVRMRELRAMVDAAGRGGERGLLRRVRGELERRYRVELVAAVGEVPSRPARPMPDILSEVAAASRRLYPGLKALAAELIAKTPPTQPAQGAKD